MSGPLGFWIPWDKRRHCMMPRLQEIVEKELWANKPEHPGRAKAARHTANSDTPEWLLRCTKEENTCTGWVSASRARAFVRFQGNLN